MKRLKKVIVSLMMLMLVACQSISVFAATVDDGKGLSYLVAATASNQGGAAAGTQIGNYAYNGTSWDYSSNTYKCSDGGYKLYSEIAQNDVQSPINENVLGTLTIGAKNDFLTDYYNAGQNVISWSKKNNNTGGITEEVGTNWLERIQNTAGVGSQLMTTLMSQTKPDYITANRLYAPFSGTVGTILGVIAILIMAFLAITMVLDIAYIAIPTFQLFIDGNGSGNGGQGGGKKKSFISHEAMEAVQMAEGGQGGGGQSGGSNKLAISIYIKKRVLMLVVLGICLLYLVSGNIFSLVGSLIDLLSGFLGF